MLLAILYLWLFLPRHTFDAPNALGACLQMTIMRNEVAVIGAGTAGLITARRLAELDVPVTVYDRKKVLGYPVRASGILSIAGLRELGLDYGRTVTNTLYGARIHAGKEVMHVESDGPKAHVLDRQKLNDLCYDEAVAQGAEVVLERKVDDQMLGELERKGIVVGADGAVSHVARHFGMGDIGRYCLTYKAEFNIEADDARMVDLFFDNKVSPGLFGWVCPNSKDILEIGIGLDSTHGNAKDAFDRFATSGAVSGMIAGSKQLGAGASMIPMSRRRRIVDAKRKILLVGDAAGQVKPSTGGGVIFGGNAAIMAAEGVREELDGRKGLLEYEKRYNRKYALDTMIHSAANRIYSGLGTQSIGYMIRLFNLFKMGGFLGRYGEMDMPSLVFRNILQGGSGF